MNAVLVIAALLAVDPRPEQQKVLNLLPFDVASCAPPRLAPAANPEGALGALRLLRPAVIECLADGRLRSGEATVTLGVDGRALSVGGAEGAARDCIARAASGIAWPAGVKASTEVRVTGPAVKLGVNAASDVAGAIRLAQRDFCDCYTGALPTVAKLEVKVKPGAAPEASGADPCLAGKVRALELSAPGETALPYTFFFIDSRADAEAADAPPELQWQQLDAIRARRSAEAALAVGARIAAVTAYDELVKRYNAARKPLKLLKDISAKCAELVKADDALVAAVKAETALDGHTADLAERFAEKSPQWKSAADAARAQAAAGAEALKKVQSARDADAKTCPK